jgi:hypothetical protein
MDLDPLLISRLQFAFTIVWPADEHRCDVAGKANLPGSSLAFVSLRLKWPRTTSPDKKR